MKNSNTIKNNTGNLQMHRLTKAVRPYFLVAVVALSFIASAFSFAMDDDSSSLVVVVNLSSTIDSVSDRELRKLFMGKSRKLPNGSRAVLASFAPASSTFNRIALARSDSEVTAAWSRLKFSGKTKPPREFSSSSALLEFVATTPNSIAYLPANLDLKGTVKTVGSLP